MLLFILLLSIVGEIFADVPECNGGVVEFNQPGNSSEFTWYPIYFKGVQPPMFPNNYVCSYKINVPPNWSAMVVLSLNLTNPPSDGAVSVIVTDQNNRIETVQSTPEDYFYFISPGGKISLATREANVTFGFAVKWTQNPEFIPCRDNVTVSNAEPSIGYTYSAFPYQIKAETRVSLIVTPSTNENERKLLRGVMIYDGPDWNSTCIGTALQLLNGKRQYVSSGQFMTVFQLKPSYYLGKSMLVFQDYENTKEIVEYQGVACVSNSNCGLYIMDGTNGNAAITTVNRDLDFGVEDLISLSGNGNIDVYVGGITKTRSNLIASYKIGNESKQLLPQEFLGDVRTYVLTGKNAILNTTTDEKAFGDDVQVGRKGFIASYYYNQKNIGQDVLTIIRNRQSYLNFKFTVRKADFVGNTTLKVSVYSPGGIGISFQELYNATNLPNEKKETVALGTYFSVEYLTFGQATNGFIIDFEALKSSSKLSIFICFFSVLFKFL